MQQSMVIQTLHGAVPGSYIQQSVYRSERYVTAAVLQKALSEVTARHDALRLQFDWTSGDIRQTVVDDLIVPLETQPWQGEERWKEFLRADRLRGVDLQSAPLVRATLFTDAPEKTRFVITYHHVLLDGRSRKIATGDLLRLLENPDQTLLPPTLPFTRYLEWLAAIDHSASMPFWREYLADLPEAEELRLPEPLGTETPSRGTERGEIPADVTSALRSVAAECQCSLNNIVQSAWAFLMARYAGASEAVFGTSRACRVSALNGAAADMVGLLINSVPIRVKLPVGITIREVLRSLRDLQMRLRDHENTPFTQIFEAAGRQGGAALYSSYMMFDEVQADEFPAWGGELYEQIEMLSLSARASATIGLTLDYDPARYSQPSMARFLADFKRILSELSGSPDRAIDCLDAFTKSIIVGPTAPGQPFANVVAAVQHWSRATPDRPAVISDAGTLTYAQLDRASNQVAHHLIGQGVSPGSVVGISIDRSADLIVAFIAIWKAGCAYLPVDLRYPEERRVYMLSDSQAAAHLTCLPDCSDLPVTEPLVPVTGGNAAYAIYTSGSTGKPKGVLISHDSLANLCTGVADSFQITQADRVLQASTINFDISVEEIFPTLWQGAALVPASDDATSSIRDFTDFVAKYQCTIIDIPTAFWHEIVVGIRDSGNHLPESVRLLIVGGERALPELFAAWKQMPEGRRVRWLNSYGPTEATVTTTLYEPPDVLTDGNLPIGHPLRRVNTYILDSRFRSLPLEISGELFIGGAGVGIGYLNAPDLTSAKFLSDPFYAGGRMYRTGDRARLLSSGEIEFLGRTDHQVKFRSYRIELGEVETAAESHPDILQAIAQVRGGNVLSLFAVARGCSTIQPETLQQWLSTRLVEWMVPTAVVLLGKLPITTGGKIDRAALAAMAIETASTEESQAPETDLERDLLNIWEKLFQKSGFGVEENFFSLGGYSLLAMRMLIEIEKDTGKSLRFADLNRAPTVRQLAKLISGDTGDQIDDCLVVIRKAATGTPLFCMHGAGGVTHWYNDLALRIKDRPVIGVQSLETAMPASVEDMARVYMDAIRKFQPRGPYYFIGHSMGGMLAYQCAVICEQHGEAVGLVGSLDGWNRAADNPSTLEKLRRLFRYFWSLHLREKIEFITEKIEWLRSERSRQKEMSSFELAGTDVLEKIKAHNVQLAWRYVAPPYGGTFHVFRARKRAATQNPDPSLGWASVAKNVVTTEVPGSHYTLLSPPNVDTLARRIAEVLDKQPT